MSYFENAVWFAMQLGKDHLYLTEMNTFCGKSLALIILS